MKLTFLILLFPFFSYSQSRIEFYINDTIIQDKSDCFLYVKIDSIRYNLLDLNLYSLLLTVDSYKIEGIIQGIKFESSSFNIMKKVSDSLIVKYYYNVDSSETGISVRSMQTPTYHKVQINSLRDTAHFL